MNQFFKLLKKIAFNKDYFSVNQKAKNNDELIKIESEKIIVNKPKTKNEAVANILSIFRSCMNNESLNANNFLIIRTVNPTFNIQTSPTGWIISERRAREIKCVIFVFGYVNTEKQYIGAWIVDNFKVTSNSRIEFSYKGKIAHPDLAANVEFATENWNAINPVVYLSHLEAQFKNI